ncbi:MAG: AAA family ATPase [Clostridium sp.]|nr:AAA family ATPase [Clostridium sp.]
MKRYRTGFVLGKFCPLHNGHLFLIDRAACEVDRLYIVVDNTMEETIPVARRISWVSELYPDAIVMTQPEPLPQDPAETPSFWDIWRRSLEQLLPEPVDAVFASEPYGERLARELGARFEMVDSRRLNVPISATSIRNDLAGCWDFLPDSVKRDMMTTVCIYGPESTGKSTLTRQLAVHFGAPYVGEYAEEVIRRKNGRIEFSDMEEIVSGHDRLILEAKRQLPPILFVDTDAITSKIWSEELFGRVPDSIEEYIARQNFTRYLLLDIDLGWKDDIHRYRPDNRADFLRRCRYELDRRGRRYDIIRGSGPARLEAALAALASPHQKKRSL